MTFPRHEILLAIGHLVDYIKTAEKRGSFGFFAIFIQKYVKLFDPMSEYFVSYFELDNNLTA